MIKSMTGFGRGNAVLNGRDITVEIKAVNHRYYELNCRLPRSMSFCEERLKTLLNGRIARGKVELSVQVQSVGEVTEQIAVNKDVVRQYVEALREIKDEFSLSDDLSLSNVMRIPDAFTVVKLQTDEEQLWEDLKTVTEEALANFITMRENEGRRMKDDLLSRLTTIEKWVDIVDERSPKIVEDYRKKLFDRMCEVLEGKEIDDGRILLEAGLFADKTAVSEETVRLRSHIAQFREMLEGGEPIGRKLDFLVQEMNRETNTIGSKVQDIEITKIVVEQKSEIEKIREQIQNIE
ncbi:MAG: YicC family protein [Oscillospiraceae bacterium]|nr:YicC family protein [Oscillospiraceae bacterium]